MPIISAPVTSVHHTSLRKRVISASAWSLIGLGVAQALRFGSNLIMTHLLFPKMFGVMAVATMVMVGLALFSDVGLGPNIMRSERGHDPLFLNTAWVIQILRGVSLWLVAVIVAILLFVADAVGLVPKATAYADPSLPYVIAILSFNAVIGGFQSTKMTEARRTLSVAKITNMELISQIATLTTIFAWASIDRSIWALVAGNICGALVATVMSHTWLPGIANRWQWDQSAYWEIIHFGKWILLSSILGFLAINGDRLMLAGLVSATLLGVYTIAFSIVAVGDQILGKIISDVSLPALSEIARDRLSNLKIICYRFHGVIAFGAYFCSGVLMVFGHTLVNLLYDKRYDDAGWMLQILGVSLLTVPFQLAMQCFLVLGLTKIYSHIHAIRVAVLYLAAPIGFHFFGVAGAIWGIVLASFSPLPLTIVYMMKFHLFDLRKEIFALPAIFAGVLTAEALNLTIPLVRAPLLTLISHLIIHR